MSLIANRHEYFEAAFKAILGKTAQNTLAIDMDVSPQYINKLIKKAKEHTLSEKAQEKIAKGCKYSLESFLLYGQQITEGGNTPPSESNPKAKAELEPESEEEKTLRELASLIAELSRENRLLSKENKELALKIKDLENQLQGMNRTSGASGQTRSPHLKEKETAQKTS